MVISSRHQLVGYTVSVVRHETALFSSKSLYGAYLIFVAQSFRVTFFSTNIWCLFSMTWSLWDQFFCGIIWVPFFRDPFSRGGRFGAGSDDFNSAPSSCHSKPPFGEAVMRNISANMGHQLLLTPLNVETKNKKTTLKDGKFIKYIVLKSWIYQLVDCLVLSFS